MWTARTILRTQRRLHPARVDVKHLRGLAKAALHKTERRLGKILDYEAGKPVKTLYGTVRRPQ